MTTKNFNINQIPMKDLDGALLTIAIQDGISFCEQAELEKMNAAIAFAAYVHRSDTRKNPTTSTTGVHYQPSSPYIQHPLRNTLRLIRLGVKDMDVLYATVLHDVIEDHSEDIVRNFVLDYDHAVSNVANFLDEDFNLENEVRDMALDYLTKEFGQEVARIVEAVSNPIIDVKNKTMAERHRIYVEHVEENVLSDPKTLLVKFSDFNDNATGLKHSPQATDMVGRLSKKYLPLINVFYRAIENHREALNSMITRENVWEIERRLYVTKIILQNNVNELKAKALNTVG